MTKRVCKYCEEPLDEKDNIVIWLDNLYHDSCRQPAKEQDRENYLKKTFPCVDMKILKNLDKQGHIYMLEHGWVILTTDEFDSNFNVDWLATKEEVAECLKKIALEECETLVKIHSVYENGNPIDFKIERTVNVIIG